MGFEWENTQKKKDHTVSFYFFLTLFTEETQHFHQVGFFFVLFLLSTSCYLVFHQNFSITSKQHITCTAPLTSHLPWELSCSQIAASAGLCNELSFWNNKTVLFLWNAGQVARGTEQRITEWPVSSQGHMETRLHPHKDTRDVSCICKNRKGTRWFCFLYIWYFLGVLEKEVFQHGFAKGLLPCVTESRKVSCRSAWTLFQAVVIQGCSSTSPFPYKVDFCMQQIFAFTEYALKAK